MRGRFGWVVDGFSLGPVSGTDGDGKRKLQVTYNRVVFDGLHVFSNSPIFSCYIIYIEKWGFH